MFYGYKKKKGNKTMAVRYKLYMNNRKNSPTKGKWYARAAVQNVVDLDALAKRIQANCTAKRADVMAVLSELVEVMTTELQNSNRVKLDGFGSFKIGLKSGPATSAKTFNAQKDIKGMRVLFQPEVHTNPATGRVRTFLTGCTVKEVDPYFVDKDNDGEDDGNGDGN